MRGFFAKKLELHRFYWFQILSTYFRRSDLMRKNHSCQTNNLYEPLRKFCLTIGQFLQNPPREYSCNFWRYWYGIWENSPSWQMKSRRSKWSSWYHFQNRHRSVFSPQNRYWSTWIYVGCGLGFEQIHKQWTWNDQ